MSMAARAGILYRPVQPTWRPEPVIRAVITRERQRAVREEMARLRQGSDHDMGTRTHTRAALRRR
jgi:hypothetical protein